MSEVPDDFEARRNFIPDDPTAAADFDPSKWTGTIMSGLISTRTECGLCGREWHEEECFPASAAPWILAATDYATKVLTAMLLGFDWGEAQTAYDVMVAEQARWMSGFAAARSGAATELDYYQEAT